MEKMLPQKEFHFEDGEIINIDKPAGYTSFDVVKLVRKWTECRKVGHAGTLDPLATGVLLVCTGKATKSVSDFMNLDKTYSGTIELGKTTDTDDREGKVLSEKKIPDFSKKEIESVVKSFKGNQKQIPPMYSALHVNGQRLYKLARKGKTVTREARDVTIHTFKLVEWKSPLIHFLVKCSKGTYVRSLARDIGEKLGTGGHLSNLRRLSIGDYTAENAYSLNDFKQLVLVTDEHL